MSKKSRKKRAKAVAMQYFKALITLDQQKGGRKTRSFQKHIKVA